MEDLAALMAPWGWSRHVARIYAWLLLQKEPVSLDDIADCLGISKSNASVAARVLEQFDNARRHSEPGSKRIRYSVPGNQFGPFASRAELLGKLARLLESQDNDSRPAEVSARLHRMSDFHREMRDAMQTVIDRTERPD